MYIQDSKKYVQNIFNLNSELETTPLLGLRILQALKDAVIKSGDTKSRYVVKGDLFGYLTAMGIERRATAQWLDAMLKTSLVLNYDPTCVDEATATQLEISSSGELHLYWGLGNYDYVVAMAETTPILDADAFTSLENAGRAQGRYRARDIIECFWGYLRREDHVYCFVPDHESYRGQRDLAHKLGSSKTGNAN